MKTELHFDVLIIGAGPAGTCAASLLRQKGYNVAIVEKQKFPRFSIGESLLPQSMTYLKNAGLVEAVDSFGFQKKDGAVFLRKGQLSVFDFDQKFTDGPCTTYQVNRSHFDKVLADECEKKGVSIFYEHSCDHVSFSETEVSIQSTDLTTSTTKTFIGRFVLDASGMGRVLSRLLKLEKPSPFPTRRAVFGHMKVQFPKSFDQNKILITVDEQDEDVWLWTIPFSNGTCSIGAVGTEEYFKKFGEISNEEILRKVISHSPKLQEIMSGAEFIIEIRTLIGYASDVTSLYGNKFALLGNAGEFLDPIFSSGVTIALHSASLAAELVDREFKGQPADWERDFSQALKIGVETFKTFVSAWYTGELQKIIFYPKPEREVKAMICSVLAGYAWDQKNPYVSKSRKNVSVLAQLCHI